MNSRGTLERICRLPGFEFFSGLHLEFSDLAPPPAAAEAILLAGDIAVGAHGIEWVRQNFPGRPWSMCFASDLDHLVRAPVALWAQGHTHESIDYTVNGTRVVCNPRAYVPREPNPSFDPLGIIELTKT